MKHAIVNRTRKKALKFRKRTQRAFARAHYYYLTGTRKNEKEKKNTTQNRIRNAVANFGVRSHAPCEIRFIVRG